MSSTATRYAFGAFVLDTVERRLMRGGEVVDVSGRYLDALMLMVREQGKLVTKDRLHDEVWKGIPVTDEAITQCIRSLRRELGDDASAPTFIETVPRHGYRFIATVGAPAIAPVAAFPVTLGASRDGLLWTGLAGVAGGAAAGLVGGLFYGFMIATRGVAGGASTVLVLACITLLVSTLGATGVSFGIAAGRGAADRRTTWTIVGGALGGGFVGGFVKLVGVDALGLVFGSAPRGITGGLEGLAIGAAAGLGVAIASRPGMPLRLGATLAALAGGVAGVGVALAGGRLMGGSLALLAQTAPNSRLDLSPLGILAGQSDYNAAAQAVCAGLEGALFCGCIAAAMLWAGRQDAPERRAPGRPEAPVQG